MRPPPDHRKVMRWRGRPKSRRERPGLVWTARLRASCCAHLARMAEAREAVAALQRQRPDLTVREVLSATPYSANHLERPAEGLRKAGLPD